MPICGEITPPLYRVDAERAAACFLYQDQPTLDKHAVNDVLVPRPASISAS
jgi:hypothetical protein